MTYPHERARELEEALERGMLELHYQPIVSLADRRVVGLEARPTGQARDRADRWSADPR